MSFTCQFVGSVTRLGVIAPREIVRAGVAPPDEVQETPFAVATDTAVTVPLHLAFICVWIALVTPFTYDTSVSDG